MFGHFPNSAAPISGLIQSLKTQVLSVAVTATLSLIKVIAKYKSYKHTITDEEFLKKYTYFNKVN